MSAERISLFLQRVKFDGFKVRQMFTKVTSGDTSGLDPEQLHQVLVKMGFLLPHATSVLVQALFAAIDINGTFRITWAEFRNNFLNPLSSSNRQAKLDFAFRAFDYQQTGSVSRDAFVELVKELCRYMLRPSSEYKERLAEMGRVACPANASTIALKDFVAASETSPLALALLSFGTGSIMFSTYCLRFG